MPLTLTPVFLPEALSPASTLAGTNAHPPQAYPCVLHSLPTLLYSLSYPTGAWTLAVEQESGA